MLPPGGEGECLAIIRIENGTLLEMADSFHELMKGFDMPFGSVVVLSSLTYLARVGTAAYAEELVIFARSSHSARTLDIVDRASINLLDATVPGFRLSPESATKKGDDIKDLVDCLNPVNMVLSI